MYPTLLLLLREVADDNDMQMLPTELIRWPSVVGGTPIGILEDQAAKLDEEERYAMCCGEHGTQQAIISSYGLQDLNTFLNEAFDGMLSRNFYEDH